MINENEAPHGYLAVSPNGNGCKDCCFRSPTPARCTCPKTDSVAGCFADHRKDGRSVVFVECSTDVLLERLERLAESMVDVINSAVQNPRTQAARKIAERALAGIKKEKAK